MSQTLVAVFDSWSQADVAVNRLVSSGVPRNDINVHANDESSPAHNDYAALSDTNTEPGIMDRLSHFFSNLFGDDHPAEVGHYHEAVRRGSALLTVFLDNEASVDAARSALYEAGAVDIDERVRNWKSSGYEAYDAAAPLYTPAEIAAERETYPVAQEDVAGGTQGNQGAVRVYPRAPRVE